MVSDVFFFLLIIGTGLIKLNEHIVLTADSEFYVDHGDLAKHVCISGAG